MEIGVKTQEEFNALPVKFNEFTRVYLEGRIIVDRRIENSSVEAWENSSVEARGNSSVVAWGNSSVVARENSSVEAWGNVCVHMQSDFATVALFMFACCYALAKGKIAKKAKTATVIKPVATPGVDGWLEGQGIKPLANIILFKRVSNDYKTQENSRNETLWAIGSTVSHSSWEPTSDECGEGKFHACSRPYFCDQFRDTPKDRYIAIKIAKDNLHVWPNPTFPHKIAFKEGKILYECDKFGRKLIQ